MKMIVLYDQINGGNDGASTCDTMLSDDLKIFIFLQSTLDSSERILSEHEESLIHKNVKRDLDHYYLFKAQLSKIDSHCISTIDIQMLLKIKTHIYLQILYTLEVMQMKLLL
jgi:hypothetical protein